MKDFVLDPRLAADTFAVCDNNDYCLRLHRNASVPWLILVPKTEATELFNCKPQLKQHIAQTVDHLASFCQTYFKADKMNIATLGNVVSQLHIHLIVRYHDDDAWPDPIWGKLSDNSYPTAVKNEYIEAILTHLKQSSF